MADKPSTELIIIRETPLESWLTDSSSVVGFIALIGIGVYLESNAMQWVGALLGFTTIIGRSLGKRHKMSIAEARKRLDEIEASLAAE